MHERIQTESFAAEASYIGRTQNSAVWRNEFSAHDAENWFVSFTVCPVL